MTLLYCFWMSFQFHEFPFPKTDYIRRVRVIRKQYFLFSQLISAYNIISYFINWIFVQHFIRAARNFGVTCVLSWKNSKNTIVTTSLLSLTSLKTVHGVSSILFTFDNNYLPTTTTSSFILKSRKRKELTVSNRNIRSLGANERENMPEMDSHTRVGGSSLSFAERTNERCMCGSVSFFGIP